MCRVIHMGTWEYFPGGGQTEKLCTSEKQKTHWECPFQSAYHGWSVPTKWGGHGRRLKKSNVTPVDPYPVQFVPTIGPWLTAPIVSTPEVPASSRGVEDAVPPPPIPLWDWQTD